MRELGIVKAQDRFGVSFDIHLELKDQPVYSVSVLNNGIAGEEYIGANYFEAFTKLRRHLEIQSIVLLCKGSRPDVVTSGMSSSMGGGRRLYVTKIGSPGNRKDLVDMLDPEDIANIGSVHAQEEHARKWAAYWKSLL